MKDRKNDTLFQKNMLILRNKESLDPKEKYEMKEKNERVNRQVNSRIIFFISPKDLLR